MKNARKHKTIKNIFASFYYKTFNFLVGNKIIHGDGRVGGFSLITRKVVDKFNLVIEIDRHYLSILRWLGFNDSYIFYEHEKRHSGKSSYSLLKPFIQNPIL